LTGLTVNGITSLSGGAVSITYGTGNALTVTGNANVTGTLSVGGLNVKTLALAYAAALS
jgi:hypothetical protein